MDTDPPTLCSKNSDNALPDAQTSVCADPIPRKRKTLGCDSTMATIVDDKEVGYDDSGDTTDKSFSVPGFLRTVLMEEFADDVGGERRRHQKLMVIATHAVMLECGFLGFDRKSNEVVYGFHPPREWPSGDPFNMSLFYSLPERDGDPIKSANNVVLEFQSSGESISVCGRLESEYSSDTKDAYTVQIDEDQLIPFANVVIDNVGGVDKEKSPGKEVFTFWRTVKDNLALPLSKISVSSSSVANLSDASSVCDELNKLRISESEEEFANDKKDAQGSRKKARNDVTVDVTTWMQHYRYPYPFFIQPIIGDNDDARRMRNMILRAQP